MSGVSCAPRPLQAEPTTWRRALRETVLLLGQRGENAGAAAADAKWIVREIAGVAGADWWLALDSTPRPDQMQRLRSMVSRRLDGEPVAYLLGAWAFRSLHLSVGPGVLVPRPETEQLVEVALERLGVLSGGAASAPLVADLGTGTGAIALSIATEHPSATCWAVDSQPDALTWAQRNLDRYPELSRRVNLSRGHWYGGLPRELRGKLDLLVSNPPYISEGEYGQLPPDVRREPLSALVGGSDGMSDVREIVRDAPCWLRRGGWLVMEVAEHRAEQVGELAAGEGARSVRVHADLAGRPRVMVAGW